jgi:FtsH-binding integral membrane protein
MTSRTFCASIAGFLIWGLLVTAIVAHITIKTGYHPGAWEILIFGLGLPFLGIFVANAIRVSIDLYLDVVNLFLSLLASDSD